MSRWLALLWLHVTLLGVTLLGGGCSETVGFLAVELEVPEITPAIECDGDPRRASTMRFFLDCESIEIEHTFAVESARASFAGVPLEPCALRVEVENAHGRLLYDGERAIELAEGDAEPVTISLTEVGCAANSSCDSDGDGVADSDEEALGIDPDVSDSDGDGLQDGVELAVCCSDPTAPTAEGCELAIQWVSPPIGKPGDAFALGTTAPFTNPQVTLGGEVVPNGAISYVNTTLFFGLVPPDAALGEVSLRTNTNVEASYALPFSVLRADAETIAELDQSAPGVKAPMTVALDSAADGRNLFLLGATSIDVFSLLPSVLRFRYEPGVGRTVQSASLRAAGTRTTPISIDARSGLVAALVYEDAQPVLYTASTETDLEPTRAPLAISDAVSVAVEPDGKHVLVLRARGLLRVDTSAAAAADMPSATIPNALGLYCTGADVVSIEKSTYAFLSCYSCPLEEGSTRPPCPQRAALVRFGPMEGCLTTDSGDCWASFRLPQQDDITVGAPVVDTPDNAQIGEPRLPHAYFLTSKGGVFSVPVLAPHDARPELLMPIRPAINPQTRHPLRVDSRRGLLYVLDRSGIQRVDLATRRPLAPVPIGTGGEAATSLALPGAGSGLAITRLQPQVPMELIHICVERCSLDAGCVCNPAGPPPP